MLQNAISYGHLPLSGNERPDLLTSLMNMSFVLRLPRKMHLCRSSSKVPCLLSFYLSLYLSIFLSIYPSISLSLSLSVCLSIYLPFYRLQNLTFCSLSTRSTIPCTCHAERHLSIQKWSEPLVFLTFWLRNVLRATTACTFSTSRNATKPHFQKRSDTDVFCTFWLGNVLRATTACTFSTSQLPKWSDTDVFCTFWLGNVLRATTACTFSIRNFQQWSGAEVFCTFWLRNVLRATMACTFSSLIWPDGSAPAALASLLFDPPEPQIIGKTQCFATFLPFRASASSFFWLFLFQSFPSLCLCPALLFICPYCRKFDF